MGDTLHKEQANYGFHEPNSFDSIDYYKIQYTWQWLRLSLARAHELVMVSELMAGFRQAS
jgi:hypothetical protein